MIIYNVNSNKTLTNEQEKITWDNFKFIIGKRRLNLNKRINHYIVVTRKCGHIYLLDQEPVLGETYIYDNRLVECVLNQADEIILSSLGDMGIYYYKGEIEIA